MKKIKINGQWVTVKDDEVQEAPDYVEVDGDKYQPDPANPDQPLKDDDGNLVPYEDEDSGAGAGGGDKSIEAEAKRIGRGIAKEIMKDLGMEDASELKKQVDSLLDIVSPVDSRLKQILNGKDYVRDAKDLTKEEKIVGFFHALVTDNKVALKALSEGTDADGGFLFPNEFLEELVREIPNINVMRQWVRIVPMKRNVMNVTNLVSGPQVFWTAENAAKSTTTARFSQLTMTARKVAAILYSSDELIEDSDIFDVVQLIIGLFAEAIADEEERVIWNGNNTTEPQGINAAGTISTVAASGQDFDDLIRLYHALPRKYRRNAAFFMNDGTAEELSKLKDANNNYLWNRTETTDAPEGTIKGKPVVISDWVPDGSIFFGDMKRAYFLGDRKRMTVKISQDTTQAFTQDETAIRIVARLGGLVAQPLAARELTGFSS